MKEVYKQKTSMIPTFTQVLPVLFPHQKTDGRSILPQFFKCNGSTAQKMTLSKSTFVFCYDMIINMMYDLQEKVFRAHSTS